MSSSDSGSEQSEDGNSALADTASSIEHNKRKLAADSGDEDEDEVEVDENQPGGTRQQKRQRRTGGQDNDGSDSDDSHNSTSLSDLDSDGDMPLQELVNSNSRQSNGSNVNATAGKSSRKVSSKAAPSSKAPSNKSKQPSSKSVPSGRTVPDHQPGSPHADLHNPAPPDEGQNTAKPLDDHELQEAIATRVKLEEGLDESNTDGLPSRPVEALVRGPALDDEEVVHDVSLQKAMLTCFAYCAKLPFR